MRFVETHVFTKRVKNALSDDAYRELQISLLLNPEQGPVIPGCGGIRKLRWGDKTGGKRGGFRVIYFWDKNLGWFYMLFIYHKGEQKDLNAEQKKLLRRIVKEELDG